MMAAVLLALSLNPADTPVTDLVVESNDLARELKVQTGRFAEVLTRDLAAFNVEARRVGLDAVR
jgi:hypothetical protein